MKTVYLAGPINGLTHDESVEWRDYATGLLRRCHLVGVSPMRSKAFLSRMPVLTGKPEDYPVRTNMEAQLAGTRGIVRRDHNDVVTADALLVNLVGAAQVSIGSMFELAWAYESQIPVVLVMEVGNIHAHAFVNESYTYVTDDIEEAVFLTASILNP